MDQDRSTLGHELAIRQAQNRHLLQRVARRPVLAGAALDRLVGLAQEQQRHLDRHRARAVPTIDHIGHHHRSSGRPPTATRAQAHHEPTFRPESRFSAGRAPRSNTRLVGWHKARYEPTLGPRITNFCRQSAALKKPARSPGTRRTTSGPWNPHRASQPAGLPALAGRPGSGIKHTTSRPSDPCRAAQPAGCRAQRPARSPSTRRETRPGPRRPRDGFNHVFTTFAAACLYSVHAILAIRASRWERRKDSQDRMDHRG